ncbi:molybdopterin-synthase adenylyltransferase MoeB, partial [Candidatus Bathyarchaeota archaeon ex4484_135]
MQSEGLLRYDRQIKVEGFGREGQLKLKQACVAVIGLGGLGCPSATYLAMSGIGRLKLVDKGRIDLSDLNRQFLYGPEDLGKPKARVAAERLGSLNPDVEVEALEIELDENSLPEVLDGV